MRSLFGSVRFRTTLAATALTAVVLTIGSVAIVQVVERNLVRAAHSAEHEQEGAEHLGGGEEREHELSEAAHGEVRDNVGAVIGALVLIVPGLVLVLAGATWFMVGRALRPVHAISERVASITSSTLDERVPEPPSHDEIAELAALMNQMLDRLQEGSERQRQFIADASHELRSPLSTIKTAAEVAQISADRRRFGQLAADVEAEADRMEAIIADLLVLARLDEHRADGPDEFVDVVAVSHHAKARLPSTNRVVSIGEQDPVVVRGVEPQIERAIFNLLLNGVQHAESLVKLQVRRVEGRVQVVVDDDGSGVAPANRERIFERFVRGDQSRDRKTGGAGIGLPIVATIAARHGGSVDVTDAPDLQGARFILDLGSEATQPTRPAHV